MLTTELNDLQEAGNPKAARAPKGCQIGSPLGQISTAARLTNFLRNCKYGVQEETASAHHIAERGPPSNKIGAGRYPGAGGFCHCGKTHVDETDTGDNLKNEASLPLGVISSETKLTREKKKLTWRIYTQKTVLATGESYCSIGHHAHAGMKKTICLAKTL